MWNLHPPLSLLEAMGRQDCSICHCVGVCGTRTCVRVCLGVPSPCVRVCLSGQSVYICLLHASVGGVCVCVHIWLCGPVCVSVFVMAAKSSFAPNDKYCFSGP